MFVLVTVRDTIPVHPSCFGRDMVEVLTEEIDAKYANKVMKDVGLCICLYEFRKITDSHVYPGDGCAHTEVEFNLLVFRPFQGEVLTGKIIKSESWGLQVSVDFFQDIFVSPHMLRDGSEFNEAEKTWVWHYNSVDDDTGVEEESDLVLDLGETIRFKIGRVQYGVADGKADEMMIQAAPPEPAPGTVPEPAALQREKSLQDEDSKDNAFTDAAMCIWATLRDDGLGVTSWWDY